MVRGRDKGQGAWPHGATKEGACASTTERHISTSRHLGQQIVSLLFSVNESPGPHPHLPPSSGCKYPPPLPQHRESSPTMELVSIPPGAICAASWSWIRACLAASRLFLVEPSSPGSSTSPSSPYRGGPASTRLHDQDELIWGETPA